MHYVYLFYFSFLIIITVVYRLRFVYNVCIFDLIAAEFMMKLVLITDRPRKIIHYL